MILRQTCLKIIKAICIPIVSSKGTLAYHISGNVDSILQPLLHNMPSLLTDTNDFHIKLNYINHHITPESTMITMDVNTLHTNILHTNSINTCRSFLNRHTTDPALINDIPIFIDFILTHNLLKFNNDHYLQIKGTAMGTKMALANANIFMDAIETSFFQHPLKNLCSLPLHRRQISNMATWQRLSNTHFRTR